MLKEDILWPVHRQYKSKTDWEPIGFFSECLFNSKQFDLLLGFFSSSAIRTLSNGFAMFLYNGGEMRLIINNILSEQDKSAVETGLNGNYITPFDLSDISLLNNILSENDRHFFECISWLITNRRIEIKIIAPRNKIGISHTKSGAFYDGANIVAFNGSCNFTQTALLDNIESIDAFCDWDDEINKAKVENIVTSFERTFTEKDDTVQYLSPHEIITNVAHQFGNKSIEELLEQEKRINGKETTSIIRPSVKKVLDKAKQQIERVVEKIKAEQDNPRFPYPSGARDYQLRAFENWKNNGQCGLFAMATGTGKTITSLNCLLEVYKKTGYYKALILVPTLTLVNQWEKECQKFKFRIITKVCSTSEWKNDISSIITREKLLDTETISFVVIATYASFVRTNIFSEINQLSAKTLLIADEAHNMGSGSLLELLPKIRFKRRIGLSATPERQYDDEGNQKLFGFFKSENGYTYEYSMKQAIDNKVLCRYYYYPHIVSLTDKEMNDYMDLSLKIAKYFNAKNDKFSNADSILTALLLKRKRIIHKAVNKKDKFKEILSEHYQRKGDLKYTLVYVPEGNDPDDLYETDIYSSTDETEDDNDALHLIDVYTQAVKELDKRITVRKFISATNNKDTILQQFAKGDIDVLTSMKCLDEGVDVPRAELAIFCASTGNPRQFVQRRGRILRTHTDKQFAYIHDLVVIPAVNPNSASYEMEKSLLKKELERVRNFSELSENSSDTVTTLLNIMNYYNLNLYNNE